MGIFCNCDKRLEAIENDLKKINAESWHSKSCAWDSVMIKSCENEFKKSFNSMRRYYEEKFALLDERLHKLEYGCACRKRGENGQ